MQTLEIPVYSANEFRDLATQDEYLLHKQPCIVDNFIQRWPAFQKWRDLEYLKDLFGDIPVHAAAPQFVTLKGEPICRVNTTFGNYIDYICNPDRAGELFRDSWAEGSFDDYLKIGKPLYCGSLKFVRSVEESKINDVEPLLPEPLDYCNHEIPYFYELSNHFWLYVSLAGALTPLHTDNNGVMTYLAQIQGLKRATLYSPSDRKHFYNPEQGYLDPLSPDSQRFPTWDQAQPWQGTIEKGQMLLFGPQWAHHVVTVEDSISFSFDFVNSTNLVKFVNCREWLTTLGQFARKQNALGDGKRERSGINGAEGIEDWLLGKHLMTKILHRKLDKDSDGSGKAIRAKLLNLVEALPE